MKKFLIGKWGVCVHKDDVFLRASNAGLSTWRKNCVEWRPGFELDGFYFSPTNLWQ